MKTIDTCNVNIFTAGKKWFFFDPVKGVREGPFDNRDKVREALIKFCTNCPLNKENEDE